MSLRNGFARAAWTALALLPLSLLATRPAFALSVHDVPKAVEFATDKGRVDPNKDLTLTVFVKLHNQAGFDKVVEELYNPESPTFHKWLTDAELERYAPTAAEFNAVKGELTAHGFKVVSTDPHRFSVRVHGTVANAEYAFQTEIHTFNYNGRVFDAHIRPARLRGDAGDLVDAVAGLERHQARPQFTFAKDPRTGQALHKHLLTKTEAAGGLLGEITDLSITPAAAFTYTTPGASLPVGTFFGNVYDANPKLTVSFTPAQLQAYYGLAPLFKQGYNGAGQTIALVEGYGYAAAQSDANVSASIFGLPALTSSNFSVIYPEGPPTLANAGDITGWTTEIALDIQSAHAIAPGAKILVVASAGQDNEDQLASLGYIINNRLANTVSSSWENDAELFAGPAEVAAFNHVLQIGAATGISFQFSSGDSGDLGLGSPVGAVSIPSDSPYATAVGGTSILNDPTTGNWVTAGWGNDVEYLNLGGVVDPPNLYGFFNFGAGGGESVFLAKPSWQNKLSGTGRQVPDVSALADPFTGFAVIYTIGGKRYVQPGIGGTSLASPIFSAIWAIADQYNGSALGQAAPQVARLTPGQITDVVGTSTLNVTDVSGVVNDSNGATFYPVKKIFSGILYSQKDFPSTIWNLDSSTAIALSFGTDSSLTVTPGWDNVTGYGEPNGLPFIQGVTHKKTGAAIKK